MCCLWGRVAGWPLSTSRAFVLEGGRGTGTYPGFCCLTKSCSTLLYLVLLQAFFQGAGNPAMAGYLAIQVRRAHVVEDALNQIMFRQADLKKPLRVTFISGGLPEPAQVQSWLAFDANLGLDRSKAEQLRTGPN